MPVKNYPEQSGGPAVANKGLRTPTIPSDKELSRKHLRDSIDYNRDHEEQHRAAAQKAEGELEGQSNKGPQYGFYRPSGPFTTVADEGEVKNGHALGHMEYDGRYLRTTNDSVGGRGEMFEDTDEFLDKFGITGDDDE
jgi:hypothetical protein